MSGGARPGRVPAGPGGARAVSGSVRPGAPAAAVEPPSAGGPPDGAGPPAGQPGRYCQRAVAGSTPWAAALASMISLSQAARPGSYPS